MPTGYRTRLLAILMADAVGYSREMAADEHRAVARLEAARLHFRRTIHAFGGRVVDMAGDSVLALFDTAGGAAQAACEVQRSLAAAATVPGDAGVLPFRIGLHLGDVIEKVDGTAYGDGVNVAARLQSVAEPGAVIASDTFASAIRGKLEVSMLELGPLQLKNLDRRVLAFRLVAEAGPLTSSRIQPRADPPTVGRVEAAKPSIAVVPFAFVSGDGGYEHIADGITEDIIGNLSRTRWLSVIAAPTMFTFKGEKIDARKVGAELGVRYVLTGTIRRATDRIRLTAHLVDVDLGHQICTERFDEPISQLFDVQDLLTARVCAQVGSSLPQAEFERAKRKHPHTLDTWDHYLLAGHALRAVTEEGYLKAMQHLRVCLDAQPDFAPAYARSALAHIRAAHYAWGGLTGRRAIALAQESAEQALTLDPDNALALDALASVYLYRSEPDTSAAFARRAIEIDPSLTAAYGTLVNALAFAGLANEALEAFELCAQVSPRDPDRTGLLMGRINALLVARRFDDCVTLARELLALKPNWYGAHVALSVGLAHLGRKAEAVEAATQVMRLVPRYTQARARRRPYFKRGEDVELLIEGLKIAEVPAR